jgi:hypothetical protein
VKRSGLHFTTKKWVFLAEIAICQNLEVGFFPGRLKRSGLVPLLNTTRIHGKPEVFEVKLALV